MKEEIEELDAEDNQLQFQLHLKKLITYMLLWNGARIEEKENKVWRMKWDFV